MLGQLGWAVLPAAAAAAAIALAGIQAIAQADNPNGAPNPYQLEPGWLKMPEGRKLGQAISVDVDRDGSTRPGTSSWGEGVTADDAGNVYVGMNDTKTVQKYVKK